MSRLGDAATWALSDRVFPILIALLVGVAIGAFVVGVAWTP